MRMLLAFLLLAPAVAGADVDELIRDLETAAPAGRWRAARDLGRLGAAAAAAREALAAALTDEEASVRLEAGRALVRVGVDEKQVATLLGRFENADFEVAQMAAEALAGLGKAAVEPLLEALESEEEKVRLHSLTALRLIGPPAAAAVPRLLDLPRDGSAAVRRHAERALRRLGPWAEEWVPEIVDHLRFGAEDSRWAAIHLLARLGPAAGEAVPHLREIRATGSGRMKAAAAQALRRIELAEERREEHPALRRPGLAVEKAPKSFRVRFATTRGDIEVEVFRKWAPHGADRLYNLVSIGFFDDAAFFRVIEGFVAQFGLHAKGPVNGSWKSANIPDDPVTRSNKRGTLTYAMAGPGTRTTQLFFNLADNPHLDGKGFAPIGRVTKGMEVLDALHAGYGDEPDQMSILHEGNAYLKREYPDLDYIRTATILER